MYSHMRGPGGFGPGRPPMGFGRPPMGGPGRGFGPRPYFFRRRYYGGCLSGCLTPFLLLFGLLALIGRMF